MDFKFCTSLLCSILLILITSFLASANAKEGGAPVGNPGASPPTS